MARENPADEKQKALQAAFLQIQKQFGQGSIMRLGENTTIKVDAIPTGALSLDIALGIGGIPRGRITEIFGAESSGKTTLAMHILANAQRLGGEAAFIDAEHALDPGYAGRIGLDVDKLLVSQPSSGEQALEITEMLVRSNAVDAICIDSVAALVPKAELEGEMGDAHVGLQARLMSQALRKLTGAVSRSNCAVIFINQIRMQIGVMFGNPETTTGGRALKFYSSIRIDVRRTASIKDGEEVLGSRTRAKVVKNKMASPFRQAEFDIIHGRGISLEGELVDMGLEKGLLQRRGTWYSYGDLQIGQGRDNCRKFLEENVAVARKLETDLRTAYELPVPGAPAAPAEPEAARKAPPSS
jgi:recombination protein RecA